MILRFRGSKVLSYVLKIKVLKTVSLGGVITGVQKTRGKPEKKTRGSQKQQKQHLTVKQHLKSKQHLTAKGAKNHEDRVCKSFNT